MRSLEVKVNERTLTRPGSRIEAKISDQIAFPKIVCRFTKTDPLFSPRINPRLRNIRSVAAIPAETNKMKETGLVVKSPMLSRFLEKRYPTMVRMKAHLPKGESDEGERSRIIPPPKPSAIAPNLSSSAIKPIRAQR